MIYDQMLLDGAPIPGKVFLHIGPLVVRRGKRYPEVICYIWRGREILSSAKWYVIFNTDGSRSLSIAFLKLGEDNLPSIWGVINGRTVFEFSIRLKAGGHS